MRPPERRVLCGKSGRLFLAEDSHDSHRYIVGERSLSAQQVDAWERGIADRVTTLDSMGCRLIHVIGPAPQVVYREDLPEPISVSDTRPVVMILERLRNLRPAPEVLYPLEDLLDVRRLKEPFSQTDSHWNDLGGYLAYEAVTKIVRDDPHVQWLTRDDVSFLDTCYAGDLGSKLTPERTSTFLRARVDRPRARLLEDNYVRNVGRKAVYECASAPSGTCLVFGDSWAYQMMIYLAESFRRVVFHHRVNVVDRSLVEQERPALVLVIQTERFCTAIPNDREAPDFDEVAARKMRAGRLVCQSRGAAQGHDFTFSLALDRGLPDVEGFRLPSRGAVAH